MRYLAFILSLAITTSAYAQWYQTSGQAHIVNGDKASARSQAMEEALKKALLVAGASVSSIKQVINGLLTQDEISIRASGSVNSFELIDELYQGDTIEVTIRADILPQEKQCFAADYRKSVLLTRSNIADREQANIGAIYSLDKAVINQLAKQLTNQSHYIQTKTALKNKTEFARYHQSYQIEPAKYLAISLASFTDSQYVLFSQINDLSFKEQANNSWQFWQAEQHDRFFDISFYLVDGNNGELVFEQNYQGSAPWSYNKRQRVDVKSVNFWQSHYGTMINNVLIQASKDIDEHIMCQPSQGKIIQANNSQVTFNLGKRHGVKTGDEFSLLHAANFVSDNGQHYAGFNLSPYKIKVTQANQDNAIAVSVNNEPLGNIQIGDFAIRY